MKKLIITLSLLTILVLNVSAQMGSAISTTDGFFSNSNNTEQRADETGLFPVLPGRNQHTDQDGDAPVGSGLLLLAGMGIAYGVRRSSKN